jgi:hypothetical protein
MEAPERRVTDPDGRTVVFDAALTCTWLDAGLGCLITSTPSWLRWRDRITAPTIRSRVGSASTGSTWIRGGG